LNEIGHIVAGDDVEAVDDLAAIEIAQERCKDDTIEVWQGKRRVVQMMKVSAA
jgi:hypothetical protein